MVQNKANADVRAALKAAGLTHWECAARIGISPATMCVWMRRPLSEEHRKLILSVISQ